MTVPRDRTITVLQVQLVSLAITVTPLIYLFVCFLLQEFIMEGPGGFADVPESLHTILFIIGLSIGTTSIFASHFLRGLMLSQAKEKSLELKMRVVLITLALSETSAIFGLVFFLLTGKLMGAAILMALGLAAAITLFPTRRWLEEE